MMTEHPIRRKMDWTLILTIIGMFAASIVFAVKVVTVHAQWMDRVEEADKLAPRVDALEKNLVDLKATESAQMTLIIRELDGIHKEIHRQISFKEVERDLAKG